MEKSRWFTVKYIEDENGNINVEYGHGEKNFNPIEVIGLIEIGKQEFIRTQMGRVPQE